MSSASPVQPSQYLCTALKNHLFGTEMKALVLWQKSGQASCEARLRVNEAMSTYCFLRQLLANCLSVYSYYVFFRVSFLNTWCSL